MALGSYSRATGKRRLLPNHASPAPDIQGRPAIRRQTQGLRGKLNAVSSGNSAGSRHFMQGGNIKRRAIKRLLSNRSSAQERQPVYNTGRGRRIAYGGGVMARPRRFPAMFRNPRRRLPRVGTRGPRRLPRVPR
jgi:hypothetical protein